MNEDVQTNEQPAQEVPSLEGVEILSNGAKIDTDTSQQQQEEETKTEDVKETKESTTDDEATKGMQTAKAEMEETKQSLSSKGVDYAKLEEEYASKGELSAESYKILEDAGYPKAMVDAVVAGWEAKAEAYANKIVESSGGKREFGRIQKFVQEQGQSAIDAFNEVVNGSNFAVVSAYIAGIKAQMVAKYGTNNPTLAGGNASSGASGYADANEMVKAMSDPRYGKDPKYMAEVEQKVAKSTFF